MLIELHVIQNFAPHNLNRDDTNAPKDCVFGGYRRARISSQCSKKAIRDFCREHALLPAESLGARTKRLIEKAVPYLVDKGREEDAAAQVVQAALESIGLGVKEGKTEYLLFLAESSIESFANACNEAWDDLEKVSIGKKKAKGAIPKDLEKNLHVLLDGTRAVDIALFGRMLADRPQDNIDAACQVAHAISTNQVQMEMDFYTAVDDLNPNEDTGAGMMGVVEFNSSCFYRYQVLHVEHLSQNLGGDGELSRAGIRAWLEASIKAIPTGKQNSMAAHNPPTYILAVVKDTNDPWNLANAFARPIRPKRNGGDDVSELSAKALMEHLDNLERMYGSDSIRKKLICSQYDKESLGIPGLIDSVLQELP